MNGIKTLVHSFTSRLHYLPDQERQQSTVRLAIGILIASYIFSSYALDKSHQLTTIMLISMFVYNVGAISLFIYSRISPDTKPLRLITGFCLDLTVGSILMIYGGASTAWIYGGFIWVIVAYGIRFGKPYMFTAQAIAVTGFGITIALTPFWQEHLTMATGLMVWLIVLPFYVAKLIDALETAIYKAEVASQAKSRFLANMSHEIRTPLTAIIGYSESALDSAQTTEDRVQALSIINDSGTHLLSLINDILDFSKIEADEMDIEHITVNPFQILSDVEAIIATHAIQKGLAFKVDYQFPVPQEITSDPVRLKQILINLCSNAIKFTPEGSVTLRLRCLVESNQLQFMVIDTGIGISREQQEKIFQPFKQAESSTNRQFGGTGLGLSLSARLAEMMGGDISLESLPDQGTTFIFTVPCGETGQMVNDVEHVSQITRSQFEDMTGHQLTGTILLAEDNITNQKLISALLKNMGATVTTADNGQEALDMALRQQYDLIYMDMQMPVMSGVEAVKALRENLYRAPIVALTANATREDRQTCLDAGCDDYLTKPVNKERLFKVTSTYLEREKVKLSSDVTKPIHSELLHKDSVVLHLLNDFIDELSRMVNHIKMSFVDENWQRMLETVHDLKGMGGGFGYPQLSELAEALEQAIKDSEFETVRKKLNELDLTCKKIYLGKLPNSDCA